MLKDAEFIAQLGRNAPRLPQERRYDFLPAAVAQACITEIFDAPLRKAGFESLGKLRWVRSTRAPIREVLCFSRLKGAGLSPCWSLSFDFIPEFVSRSFRNRKRPLHTPLHLHEDPLDFPEFHLDKGDDDSIWILDTLFGKPRLISGATRLLPLAMEMAERWFRRCRTLKDAAEMFEEWQQRKPWRLGYYNYVIAPFAHACVVARLGDEKRAKEIVKPYRESLSRDFDGHPMHRIILQRLQEVIVNQVQSTVTLTNARTRTTSVQ